MSLKDRLTEDMQAAMRSGDKARLSVLRMALAGVILPLLMPSTATPQAELRAWGNLEGIRVSGQLFPFGR